jgi:ubiquitin-conjugating enzyme (huntingtin interacting protein 2)
MAGLGRIRKELEDIRNDRHSGVSIVPDASNPQHLVGTITGPPDTPYAGGKFQVDIVIPNEYPFSPPKMKFITKVYHPNVSSVTGAICLDILKDQWSPALTMKTALISLQALLCAPEPDDPQDAVVANIYKTNRAEFDSTAREWTLTHADPNGEAAAVAPTIPPSVRKLMDMGFTQEAATDALAAARGDENAAIEALLTGA